MSGTEKWAEGLTMNPIKVAAVADVHSPRFLNEFRAALTRCETPDLFLFAGDMINRGKANEYPKVLDAVESQLGSGFPVVACFGNEEPQDCHDEIRLSTKDRITILDEKGWTINISGVRISIIGMSAANPQSNSVNEMRTKFEARSHRLSGLLQSSSQYADYVVLLMHFSPLKEVYSTEFSWWISKAIEKNPPSHIIHGHIHDSIKNEVKIGPTVIRNVALPATGSITELNV
ncbi:MAG: metallophosphoesterase [Candidatus Thorarchaeota archaeon]|jgi:Icc-related predicted phosphoesterase